MSSGPTIFLVAFLGLSTSWLGFVLAPVLQIGNQGQVEAQMTGNLYPAMRSGLARQGEQVYKANGCVYCHSQQVRPLGFGSDVERGWGARPGRVQSVNQDYLYDEPAMVGNQRVGPDLSNYGLRQTNASFIYQHLYCATDTMPGSVMPPYRFLFEKRKLAFGEKASAEALTLTKDNEPGYEIIPTEDARRLTAYLMSLHQDAVLFETPPLPKPATNDVNGANAGKGSAK